jgi:hypothetical protein
MARREGTEAETGEGAENRQRSQEFARRQLAHRAAVRKDPETDLKGIECMIRQECLDVAAFLVAKNQAYGNSALDPVRCFSKADPLEQLKVRLDDKLSRLMRGDAAGEDVELDLLGYLVLLRIARKAVKVPA